MFITKNNKIFSYFFIALTIVGLFISWFLGIKPGMDFIGGSLLEVSYQNERPTNDTIRETVATLGIKDAVVQPSEEKFVIIRSASITENNKNEIVSLLSSEDNLVKEERFNFIGPSVGGELKTKAVSSMVLVTVFIVLYIAFAFRRVSGSRVSSWKYGLVTIVTLIHDISIPLAVFAILGRIYGYEADILLVTALLTVLGYSVNDTIVVFDRIRENLSIFKKDSLVSVAGKGLRQTISRSINTSLTTLCALLALYFFGGETTRMFSLILSAGVVAGTFSSIFLATPLLVMISGESEEMVSI